MPPTEPNTLFDPAAALDSIISGNQYPDSAYALAELIDNSIQAGAKEVKVYLKLGQGSLIKEIAVYDDGIGMDRDVLKLSLKLGAGTRKGAIEGLGKFGMGLPTASVSVCKNISVWSWQNKKIPLYTFLDVDKARSGVQTSFPDPKAKAIPKEWPIGDSSSGTMVLWSNIDYSRLDYKKGDTLIRHTEFLIGRMYRHHIKNSEINISFVKIDTGGNTEAHTIRSVDPLFLTPNAAIQDQARSKEILFDQYPNTGAPFVINTDVLPGNLSKEARTVRVRYSMAKPSTQYTDGTPQGRLKHGKYAKKLIGVSVRRANRELNLSTNICKNSFADRWWGVQIDFGPALDEVFGTNSTKTRARKLEKIFGARRRAESNTDWSEIKREWTSVDDQRSLFVAEIVDEIWNTTNNMLRDIKEAMETEEKTSRTKNDDLADKYAAKTIKKRDKLIASKTKETGKGKTTEDKRAYWEEWLSNNRSLSDEDRKQTLDFMFDPDNPKLSIVLEQKIPDFQNMFWAEFDEGRTVITLNTNHKIHKFLMKHLSPQGYSAEMSGDEAKEKLAEAVLGLRVLIHSWARMESEMVADEAEPIEMSQQEMPARVRTEWGRIADDMLSDAKK